MRRMNPGESCPAVLIGKFEIVTAEDGEMVTRALREMSDQQMLSMVPIVYLAVVKRDVDAPRPDWIPVGPGGTSLVITCGRCLDRDFIPLVRGTNVSGDHSRATWSLTAEDPVNVEPSILNLIGVTPSGGGTRCHYLVRLGRFELLPDSTPHST